MKDMQKKRTAKFKSRLRRLMVKQVSCVISETSEFDSNDCDAPAADGAGKLREPEAKVDELCEALDELRLEKVDTMDKGHYNHKIRECCMKLMSHNCKSGNPSIVVKMRGQLNLEQSD